MRFIKNIRNEYERIKKIVENENSPAQHKRVNSKKSTRQMVKQVNSDLNKGKQVYAYISGFVITEDGSRTPFGNVKLAVKAINLGKDGQVSVDFDKESEKKMDKLANGGSIEISTDMRIEGAGED